MDSMVFSFRSCSVSMQLQNSHEKTVSTIALI